MATPRQLSRLVSAVGTISSGAVRTYLGRTQTTRQGLEVVPKLMRFVSGSIATGAGDPDEDTSRAIATYLCRLILRYGTMRRAMEAIAHGRRTHPAISVDRARGWSEAFSVSVGSIDPILRRYPWLRIQLSKWLTEQGPTGEQEMGAFEQWMDGPLPGSDDEHEFPVLAEAAGTLHAAAGVQTASPDDHRADPLGGSELPDGVSGPGEESDDTRLVLAMLASTRRPGASFGERVQSDAERAALERLRRADGAFPRALACVIDRAFAPARACLDLLADAPDSAALATLRAALLGAQDQPDDAMPLCRTALALARTPEDEASCMAHLGMTLLRCQRGSASDRAREARELLARAVRTLPDGSTAWGIAQMQRALAEMTGPSRDRAESVRTAISCLESAVKALSDTNAEPALIGEATYWLGCAWLELPAGNRRENIERALARFNDALAKVRRSETPGRWATIHVEMGIAWERMPTSNRAEALENAIGCFTAALGVRRRDSDPTGWARIQNNLGNLWVQFPSGNQRQNIERAIAHQQSALEVWSEEDRRLEWATTQSNLGNAWALLPAEGEERERNLRRSISCYKSALEVRTRATHPLEWATTQNNLGSALLHLPTRGRASNVKEAIACYEQALEIRTRERFPAEWAKTQANLGNAWLKEPTGPKPANLERAIGHYQRALDVLTRERFPRQNRVITERLRETQQHLRDLTHRM